MYLKITFYVSNVDTGLVSKEEETINHGKSSCIIYSDIFWMTVACCLAHKEGQTGKAEVVAVFPWTSCE